MKRWLVGAAEPSGPGSSVTATISNCGGLPLTITDAVPSADGLNTPAGSGLPPRMSHTS